MKAAVAGAGRVAVYHGAASVIRAGHGCADVRRWRRRRRRRRRRVTRWCRNHCQHRERRCDDAGRADFGPSFHCNVSVSVLCVSEQFTSVKLLFPNDRSMNRNSKSMVVIAKLLLVDCLSSHRANLRETQDLSTENLILLMCFIAI
jgi:hypothetical protein